MKPGARRMYRLLAGVFLVIGVGFLVAVAVQALVGARFLDARALGPAVVLLVVGLLLVWTIRQLPPVTDSADEGSAAEVPGEEGPARPPERDRGDGPT